jgi:hypothetical protein
MTLGTARPKAHGHEATSTLIPLSNIQQMLQLGISTIPVTMRKVQVVTVNRLKAITTRTNTLVILLHIA